jgi:sulfate transport system permease protein
MSAPLPDTHVDPRSVRLGLIALGVAFLTLILVLPVVVVRSQAFAKGVGPHLAALTAPDTLAALRLTLPTAAIAVPANQVFGLCAAWATAKFELKGKQFLITLFALPCAVSPVIASLI